jgi:hypothetical protein
MESWRGVSLRASESSCETTEVWAEEGEFNGRILVETVE